MDYKEKYEQALEIARVVNPGTKDYNIVTTIFPELKESEDERIRKAIKETVEYYWSDDTQARTDISAWLEKQGTPAKLSEEEQNRIAKGVLTSCALSFIDYLDAHKYEGKMCVSNGECKDIENAFHNAMWDRLHRYYCKYIEKQGEQKHVVVPRFRVGDVIRPKGSTAEYTIESISGGCYHGKGWGLFIGCDEDYELVEHKFDENV